MHPDTGCVQEDSGTRLHGESVVFSTGPSLEQHFSVNAFKTTRTHPIALQHCYRLTIQLADNLPDDLRPWLGQLARLAWGSDGYIQYWHGIINGISTRPAIGRQSSREIHLASPLLMLQNSGPRNRVFVAQRIPQIVETLVREHLPSHYTVLDLTAPSPALTLVRQHQETHFSFMHRILSTAGISFTLIGDASGMQLVLVDAAAQRQSNHPTLQLIGLEHHQPPQLPNHATALCWTDEPLALAPDALAGIRIVNPWHNAATNKETPFGPRLCYRTQCRLLRPGSCFELAGHPSLNDHYRVITLNIRYCREPSQFQCDVEAVPINTPFLPTMPDTARLARTPAALVDEQGQYRYHHPYADSLNGNWYP